MLSVLLFLFANIKVAGTGEGYMFLAAGAFCIILPTALSVYAGWELRFRPSTFFLLGFLTYFLFKVLLDISDLAEIKAITVGTSGGLVFALLLGSLLSLGISAATGSRGGEHTRAICYLACLAACCYLSLTTYQTHLAIVRDDFFLVDVAKRQYQRPGDFLVIIALISSLLIVRSIRQTVGVGLAAKAVIGASVSAYIAAMGLLLVTSQLIGSNKGFAVTLAILVGTAIWIYRPMQPKRHWLSVTAPGSVNAISAFLGSLPGFLLVSFVLVTLLLAGGAVLLDISGLELDQFRIFGFAGGRVGGNSLASRLDILSNNFPAQFALNPVFGNLKADDLTTGKGSYAHSLLSLLSHLGIVGAFLFCAYVYSLYSEFKSLNSYRAFGDRDIDLGLFRIGIIMILLVFALVATFFTWMPLWFAFGMLCPPLIIRKPRAYGTIRRSMNQPRSVRVST